MGAVILARSLEPFHTSRAKESHHACSLPERPGARCLHCIEHGLVFLCLSRLSINQAIKAVAISRGYLEENKLELTCYPEFRVDKRSGLNLVLL